MKIRLSEIAAGIGGQLQGADAEICNVSTDSRSVGKGELFLALRGERFDAHDFVSSVPALGAAAAVVDTRFTRPADLGLPLIVVDDTRLALGRMAAWWRARFVLPLIGVTGSNGKTTVKEMCAAILRTHFGDDAVLATTGNLNNDIGMPKMLLRLDAQHRAAVIEMGMNHPGEIGYLTRIARPSVALVNNAQRAHLEGMGGLDAVAQEKGAIYEGLGVTGIAVVNADDPHAALWRAMNAGRTVLDFGIDAGDVRAHFVVAGLSADVQLDTPQGSGRFTLKVPGAHNVRNAAAAAAACLAAGVPLEAVTRGLGAYAGTKGRLQARAAENGATVLDDSYNANPDSMRAGIDVLAMTPGRKLFVFGDMGEIGDRAAQYHDEIGGYAKSQGVDMLFALGEHAEIAARNFGEGGAHFDSVEALVAALRHELAEDAVVLVKGSRFMKMERIADAIALKDQ